MATKRLIVLLAEDNRHDVVATRRAWKLHGIENPLHVVRDGEECLDYLYRRGRYGEPGAAPRPGLLVLDIKMPKVDGLGVLRAIRSDERLRLLPVTMLTTSDQDEDRLQSYDLGANAFIRKPLGFEGFAAAIKAIAEFWQLVEPARDFDSWPPGTQADGSSARPPS